MSSLYVENLLKTLLNRVIRIILSSPSYVCHYIEANVSVDSFSLGATLNITFYISPPFFMMKPDANNTLHPDGYIHDLIELLKERMKFEYNYTVASSDWSFDDLVKSVENNKCEIVAADLAMTPSRAKKIDFSFPIYDNTLRLVVRRGKGTEFSPFEFLKPFHWTLWISIFFIIYICSVLLITLHEWLEQEENRRRETTLNKTPKAQYDTWLMLLRKGLTFQPKSFFGSCQTIIVSPISVIFIALLTTNLIIYFKAQYEKPWLQSIEDLRMCQKVACDRIGVIGGSHHEEFFLEEVMNNAPKKSYHRLKHTNECYEKLLDHRIDVAIADSSSADYFTQMPGYCELETTGVPFGKTYFGIAMSKQWPYKQDLDNEIMYLKSTGELDRLLARWFQKKHCDQKNDHVNKGLTIPETSGLFIIFAGLTGVNLIIFLCRYLLYYRNKRIHSESKEEVHELSQIF
jgi:ABC-type amino acid transport substrate-binding protein